MIYKLQKTRWLTYVILYMLFILGIMSVLYFSWIESPRFSLNNFVPKWIANWADKHANDNIRTAVPFVFLGILTSSFLILRKRFSLWLISWLMLVVLVIIAELGQLLLPLRSFDLKDVYWGALGAFIPLVLTYILLNLLNRNARKCKL